MKKLATLTAVIALATALGIAVPAKADKPTLTLAGCTALGREFTLVDPIALTGHCHKAEVDRPLTLRSLCIGFDGDLPADTNIRNTTETTGGSGEIDGDCTIDLKGFDLSIQGVTVTGTGDLTIVDSSGGGLLRIIDSNIDLAGLLDASISVSGDITIRRNIVITVGDDEDVTISGRGINFRDASVTSNNFGGINVGDLTITGAAGISFKDNLIDGFANVGINFTNADGFFSGNDFDGAIVLITITGTGDCSWKDNTNPSDSECP